MGKFRVSLKVRCLYYDGERNQEIFCKGLMDNSRIHQGFAHPGLLDTCKERFCETQNWQDCPIARMLASEGIEPDK
ncbi:MAG: hypothetical protein IJB11_04505 [Oscillospiraceae bacterium]|nr:hypothetical protein [Oscillospiraceae bacterium]